ncbi:MAG: nucleotidyltransferase domain-containing protein [Deltaproteobacteria bacterium]|nr:nucleotidyltransferase domain-containing protein [Deltaproteobacteria bacterium]
MAHSGKFVLRIEPKFHRLLSQESERRKTSLNTLCIDLLKRGFKKGDTEDERFGFLKPIIRQVEDHFGSELEGILIFGSQVTGQATESSDLDLLIVLKSSLPLTRSLYRWWDEKVSLSGTIVVNPQFAHIPLSMEEAGSLWLEVATASQMIWERDLVVTDFLELLREFIASDRVRRNWSQGQPYWVRQDEEQRLRS